MTDHAKETNAAIKADGDGPAATQAAPESASSANRSPGQHQKNHAAFLVVVLVLLAAFLMLNLHWVATVPNYQAQTQLDARNLTSAEWWLDLARNISPNNAESEYLLGRLRRRQGDLPQADEHLSVARELGYDEVKIERERQLVSVQRGELPEDSSVVTRLVSDAAWDSAEIYEAFTIGVMKAHKYELVRPLLNEWYQMFPKDPRPWYYQGQEARGFQEWRQAEESFRHALHLDPQYHQAATGLAEILVITEKYDEALILFRAAEKSLLERHAALVGQATCLRMTGDSAAARSLVEAVLADRPDMKSASIELAYLELDAGNFEAARKLFAEHIVAEARNYNLNRAYSAALRGCGDEESAQKYSAVANAGTEALIRARLLGAQITGKPEDLPRRYDLGAIHLDYGSEQQGVAILNSILFDIPAHPASLKKLAEYYESKQTESAENATLAKQYRDRYEKSRSAEDQKKTDVEDQKPTDVKDDSQPAVPPTETKVGEPKKALPPENEAKDSDSNE